MDQPQLPVIDHAGLRQALQEGLPAVIEAGTGTGKTLGYLVPIVLSEKKAVVSTGTKNLQDQIFERDIPLLSRVLGRPVDAMIMKGRKNYLCLHRYHQFFSQPSLLRPDLGKAGKRIETWLATTRFADRAELLSRSQGDGLHAFWRDLQVGHDVLARGVRVGEYVRCLAGGQGYQPGVEPAQPAAAVGREEHRDQVVHGDHDRHRAPQRSGP